MRYDIDVTWYYEAGVWSAVCDDIPIALESNSFDALIEKVKNVACEILELNWKTEDAIQLCFKNARTEKIKTLELDPPRKGFYKYPALYRHEKRRSPCSY